MAYHSRLKVLAAMIKSGLVPVFYVEDATLAAQIIDACIGGGALCVEFTNRGDRATRYLGVLSEYYKDKEEFYLGAGTIVEPTTAGLYVQLGADFIVGPVLNPEVARLCNRRKVTYCPGCGSASEISQAEELGVEICKIFPGADVGGPSFVKAVRAPMPWSRLMPTGGVELSEQSIKEWIRAGAACLGMGSQLITRELVEKRDFEGISRKCQASS